MPFHDAVGNHEIGQGAEPEDVNWTSLYGPTHYSYTDGDAEFIVTDSANGGLLASDPYQVPSEEQYQWLASQLTASTSKVVFLVTHMPADDPHAVMNSQFADRYEAQMYEQLAATFQASHPQTHVILLFGHARGVAEQSWTRSATLTRTACRTSPSPTPASPLMRRWTRAVSTTMRCSTCCPAATCSSPSSQC